jgi:hypothetical protein
MSSSVSLAMEKERDKKDEIYVLIYSVRKDDDWKRAPAKADIDDLIDQIIKIAETHKSNKCWQQIRAGYDPPDGSLSSYRGLIVKIKFRGKTQYAWEMIFSEEINKARTESDFSLMLMRSFDNSYLPHAHKNVLWKIIENQ